MTPPPKACALWFVDSAGMAGIGRLTVDGTTWTHVWDVRAGGQAMKVRLALANRTPASGDWRIEAAVAGSPWTIIGEGTHQKTN